MKWLARRSHGGVRRGYLVPCLLLSAAMREARHERAVHAGLSQPCEPQQTEHSSMRSVCATRPQRSSRPRRISPSRTICALIRHGLHLKAFGNGRTVRSAPRKVAVIELLAPAWLRVNAKARQMGFT